jgi:cellulose synthase/poly-beta-1,6-N-acetylglucosamine synthase-like glycosyltransferase
VTDLEIPLEKDRKGHYRFFEILPGFLSYLLILLPLILTLINTSIAVFFIIIYILIFFVRSVGYSIRAIDGYITMRQHMKLDWNALAEDIDRGKVAHNDVVRPKWHYKNLRLLSTRKLDLKPSELYHAVIIATVNESREVLEPTIQALLASDYDMQKVILVLAYEGRVGKESHDRVLELLKLYGDKFKYSMAVKHPEGIPNEIIGKGGNITYAGRALLRYVKHEKLDPKRVLVTTLDSDNRVDPKYLSSLSYLYCVVPNPVQASYQPLAMYTNNIWDAPTMMRVLATSNNLFYIVNTKRPHMSRNFSAHAQPLQGLIDTDFWSTRTVVEDGHQFWRSYFRYEGDYRVYPFSIPIYQDAVLAEDYWKTLKTQFIQLRRWTYGASDVAFIADKGFWHKNKIPKTDVLGKLLRTLESHVTWATGPIIVYFASRVPAFFSPQNLASNQLPLIVSKVQLLGIIGLLMTLYVCLITLPPRPARHKRHRSLFMLLQWVLLPVTSLAYGSMAAYNSQTRLMFKRYLSRFDVTDKTVVGATGKKVSTVADPSK